MVSLACNNEPHYSTGVLVKSSVIVLKEVYKYNIMEFNSITGPCNKGNSRATIQQHISAQKQPSRHC